MGPCYLPAQYLFEGQAPQGYEGEIVYLDILDAWDDFQLISDQMTIQRAAIDSTGHFRLAGNELPPGTGFYRLRYARKTEPMVSMNFGKRHFVHFLATASDSLQFTGLFLHPLPEGNRLIDEVADKLDVLATEERHAETIRLTNLINNKRRELLATYFPTASAAEGVYLLGNWPDEGPPLALLKKLEAQLEKTPTLRSSYLSSLRERIGALDGGHLRQRNRQLSWLLVISLLANGACFVWWWRQSRSAKTERPAPNFTAKEEEVLDLIAEGKTNKEIASTLFISTATVKTHVNNIYKKAGLSNRKAAVAYGRRQKSNPV